MYINKQIQRIYGISDHDFVKWCVDNNLKRNKINVSKFIKETRNKMLNNK